MQCTLGFSTYRVKYANLHLNGDTKDNGNAKYAESGGVWKLIFFFLLLFLAWKEEGLEKNYGFEHCNLPYKRGGRVFPCKNFKTGTSCIF